MYALHLLMQFERCLRDAERSPENRDDYHREARAALEAIEQEIAAMRAALEKAVAQ